MESNLCEDRISNLPDSLIKAILIRLPLRSAVRTSILSSTWRYKWSTIPHLVLFSSDLGSRDLSQTEYVNKLVGIVDQVLLLHHGPIRRFGFYPMLQDVVSINRWILFLSRNGIREFILKKMSKGFKVPSCLFSCEELTCLELDKCALSKPPSSFRGFQNLTTLSLFKVYLVGSVLEKLTSSSPLLTKLKLAYIYGCPRLKLCAPNLVDLDVESAFQDLSFERTPVLTNVSILLSSNACKSTHLLGVLPSVKRLELLGLTYQILSASAGDVPVKLTSTCQLKHLLASINFEDMMEMLAVICIFRSSPFLQKVDIMSFSTENKGISVDDLWGAQEDLSCFSQLQILNMKGFTGTASELKFVEIVLANAPVLQMVNIEVRQSMYDVMKIARKLLLFRRISSNAEIFIPE